METGEWGHELTRWSARLAAAGWLAWLLLVVSGRRGSPARWAWTAGLLAHLVHVFCAFHFVHHWSHTEAYKHTATLTETVTGFDWGGGLWINYLFTLTWLADAAWWWCRPPEAPRPRWWGVTLNASFTFLFVNATVVFGPWGWKVVGVLAAGVVCGVWHSTRGSKQDSSVAGDDLLEQGQ